jgi:hypothetical protein
MKKIFTYIAMAMIAMTAFTACEPIEDWEDRHEARTLDGNWTGYIDTYYYDRWGLSGKTYETTMRFVSSGMGATSGRGYEVDYDTRSPFNDYASCEFSWSIVNGVITLLYDDSMWYPVYITNYSLYRDYFAGYINDGTRRDIRFKLENVTFGYWDTYRSYYDDYYYDDYYYSRTRSADSTNVAADSIAAVSKGKSIASGAFAK